uniref:Uncharacterized protein n=1 Tax=Anguilla anguilla TaxID=7936 RepID=A0A0E9W7W0_ANGAN
MSQQIPLSPAVHPLNCKRDYCIIANPKPFPIHSMVDCIFVSTIIAYFGYFHRIMSNYIA